ncbi:MAG: glutathione S-transferase N-terminal domain-containing protein [SAR324 cluster bacterium]|nr:glutathione S-transferase N-terminal domain-containing protein [SAR324 cluster bacterium]
MNLELYYYRECPFCQIVLNAIQQLGIEQLIQFKNTREHPDYRNDLQKLTGRTQVPCLVIDGKPMLESRDIASFLEKKFMK